MRSLVTPFVVLLLFNPLASGAATMGDQFKNTDCNKAKNQLEEDYCAGRELKAADGNLNTLYRAPLDAYDAQNRELLKAAERNWISYRDSECDFESASSAGGSIYPQALSMCLISKTGARIQELERQRDCGDEFGCNAPH